mmetsp:Transcript_12143/g.22713  ORF Transcript_12143/g.22713 Transcript_12143/m.22713 type:complete len:498 (+) Transcript_12143:45-1538(+)
MAAVRDGLRELFVYTKEENDQLPLRDKLEQVRALRAISQSEWARCVLVTNHDLRALDRSRRCAPLAIDFPVHVFWDDVSQPADPSSSPSFENTRLRSLQVQPSDPLEICIMVLRVGKSTAILRDALKCNPQVQSFVNELTWPDSDAPGHDGAKLVCRPEQKESIQRHLREHGAPVQGEVLRLAQMRPRHILVTEDFYRIVDSIISSLPRSARGKMEYGVQVKIPLVDLEQTVSGRDNAMEHASPLSGNVHRRASQRDCRAHPYSHSSSHPTSPSASSSRPSHTHDGEQRCRICNATFASEDQLLRHMTDFHAGENAVQNPGSSSTSAVPLQHDGTSSQSILDSVSMQPAAGVSGIVIDEDCPSTQIEEEDEEERAESAQEESRTCSGPQPQAASVDINRLESHSIVIYRGFVTIPNPPISEGQQTASTGEGIGVNPRRAAKLSRAAALSSSPSLSLASPSQSLSLPTSEATSTQPSLPSSLTPSLSLERRLQLDSQE